MLDPRFVFVAIALNLFGIGQYLQKAIRGDVRPHPITWLLWAVAPLVAFAAQVTDGVGLPALTTAIASLNPILVLLVLARSDAAMRWTVTPIDVACGFFAISALIAWSVLRDSAGAVLLAILADGLAAIPTYVKAWRSPHSESWVVYICLTASATITVLAVDTPRLESLAFALYLGILGFSLALIVLFRGRSRFRAASG